ncbi:MAG: SDR family oxidoreductase [Bacteroidales bacterium]|nr:SDR family oxidoreductase [Bacteroidales bacterium]
MRTIFLTGANGLIAQAILNTLSTADFKIIAVSKSACAFNASHCIFEIADITDFHLLETLLNKYKPDVVINCAAISKPDLCEVNLELCWNTNYRAVARLSEYCTYHNIFLIHFSSDFIFSGKNEVYSEISTPEPLSFYGISKRESELVIQRNCEKYAIIRTSLVYGYLPRNNYSNFVLWVVKSLQNKIPIKVVADQYRTPTYDFDIALAIKVLVNRENIGISNLAGKDLISVYDLAMKVAQIWKLDGGYIEPVMTSSLNENALRPKSTHLDISKAKNELGYYPNSLSEGLNLLKNRMK